MVVLIRLQRYNKFLECANFFAKKYIFQHKRAMVSLVRLHNSVVREVLDTLYRPYTN